MTQLRFTRAVSSATSALTLAFLAGGCGKANAKASLANPSTDTHVKVDEHGFTPSAIALTKGGPGTLTFTRTSDATCAKDVVIPELAIKKELPMNTPVTIDLPTDKDHTYRFTCGMGMFESSVVVR